MNFIQQQAYAGFWYGAAMMISLHNTVLSFFLYKTRKTNVSNLIKIIFNFSNFFRFGSAWGQYMTPKVATFLQCASLSYIGVAGNIVVRSSVVAFLLWRLKQVHNSKMDTWISITLFIIRVGLGLVQFGYLKIDTLYLPEQDIAICNPDDRGSLYYIVASVVVELIVDIYVTIRLVQLLRKANQNAASISSNMVRKSKRTLFTAVMYWNFLRLFVAVLFHALPLYGQFIIKDETTNVTVFSLVNILLTYVITVDAEIVRVIEGKETKKGGTSEKSFSMPQSPRTQSVSRYNDHSPNDLPNYSQIDEDKLVVVSMKRLSFFEWANFVTGKRIRKNNEQGLDENTEEIIDGLPKAAKEDIEKGFPQDRSSSFSGTTSASTLDENPEIFMS